MEPLDLLFTLVSLFIVLGAVLNTWAFVVLFRLNRRIGGRSRTLRERRAVAGIFMFTTSMLAVLALNRLFGWQLNNGIAVGLLTGALVIEVFPAIYWLFSYYTGKFD